MGKTIKKKKTVKRKSKKSKPVKKAHKEQPIKPVKKKTAAELEAEADALLKAADKKEDTNKPTATYYFDKVEEEAFLEFIRSDDKHHRDMIYNKYLNKPFKRMVESILRRYPIFIGNYTMEEVEASGLVHLISNMSKFNPTKVNEQGKKYKAFSYCQTIVRNFYRDWGKKMYAEKISNLNYDDHCDEIENKEEFIYEIDFSNDEQVQELILSYITKLRDKINNDKSLRRNEIIVGEAIINVLESWDILFLEETRQGKYNKRVTNNYTKNKVLLLLKEQTRLSTKDIRASMEQFKELYFLNKKLFYSDEDE